MKKYLSTHKKADNRTKTNKSFCQNKHKREPFFAFKSSNKSFFKTLHSINKNTSQGKENQNLSKAGQNIMENSFERDFSNVKIYKNSHQANKLNALAFTQGNSIHFAPGQFNPNSQKGRELIGHELAHIVQQRNGQVKPTSEEHGIQLNNDKSLEREADIIGRKAGQMKGFPFKILEMKNHFENSSISRLPIQRHIRDSKELKNGKMELDFTKVNGTFVGDSANEEGWVKFHPNDKAPDTTSIKLIQIVRNIDITGVSTDKGKAIDFTQIGGGMDRINDMRTTGNGAGVAANFSVDTLIDAQSKKRTSKTDPEVSPYYMDHATGAEGSKSGNTKVSATLWDGPGTSLPVKFQFVTAAKDTNTGAYYGTALWGFETFKDATGITKIKDEYYSFRENQGATMDAAIDRFNEYYQNTGSSSAPTT